MARRAEVPGARGLPGVALLASNGGAWRWCRGDVRPQDWLKSHENDKLVALIVVREKLFS